MKLKVADSSIWEYQLLIRPNTMDTNIINTIVDLAMREKGKSKLIGRSFPSLKFKDINKKKIDGKNKLLVIKFWFINCVPCVKEMPTLNNWKESFEKTEDILFISLALDNAKLLKEFSEKISFKYAIIPDQSKTSDLLGITTYPTHMVIGKNGQIENVFENMDDLFWYFEKYYRDVFKFITPISDKVELPPPPPPRLIRN